MHYRYESGLKIDCILITLHLTTFDVMLLMMMTMALPFLLSCTHHCALLLNLHHRLQFFFLSSKRLSLKHSRSGYRFKKKFIILDQIVLQHKYLFCSWDVFFRKGRLLRTNSRSSRIASTAIYISRSILHK